MLDSCGCCKVCARQLFEDCSKTQPCDTAKGLECNFGGGRGSAAGVCRGTPTSAFFPYANITFLPHFQSNLLCFLSQPNQTGDLVSLIAGFIRMGKPSVQTADTSALAWMGLWDASPCALTSSHCPNWTVPSQSGSKYGDSAVNNSSALMM